MIPIIGVIVGTCVVACLAAAIAHRGWSGAVSWLAALAAAVALLVVADRLTAAMPGTGETQTIEDVPQVSYIAAETGELVFP